MLEFPISLVDGVRIDSHFRHHLLDRGEPVAHLEHARPDGLADLLRKLEIRGYTRVGSELEREELTEVGRFTSHLDN